MPGAHKIGAAISGPRITSGNFMDITLFLRAGFRQNGFFADFYFRAAGFFRGFSRRIFSPNFCGKKCPEESSRKIPGKILQNLHNKNPPTHFCRLAGAIFLSSGKKLVSHLRRGPNSNRILRQGPEKGSATAMAIQESNTHQREATAAGDTKV